MDDHETWEAAMERVVELRACADHDLREVVRSPWASEASPAWARAVEARDAAEAAYRLVRDADPVALRRLVFARYLVETGQLSEGLEG
jgi:hypothetical protein